MILDPVIKLRNNVFGFFYKEILKRIFFRLDPEIVHDRMNLNGQFLGKYLITRKLTSLLFSYSNKSLEQNILGIKFKNPIGLSAGFDKDANLTDILPCVGFGFAEVGSITGEPCEGNPKPRLFRLKKSQSLVVYYGLKNKGAEEISNRLKNKRFNIPVGISIAKTNNKETCELSAGIKDYVKAYKAFANIGAYITINISCPNTYGGQPFTDSEKLDKLLFEIDKIPTKKPIFLKVSPDLSKKEIDAILEVAKNHKVDGFVCTNLTKNRNNKKILDKDVPKVGGISGKVVEDLSNELISYIYKSCHPGEATTSIGSRFARDSIASLQNDNGKKREYIIIGVGGVFSAEDAYKKIKSGANLIQMITGIIYEGPQVISEINQGLVKLLKNDNYSNISKAVGVKN
ncbi:MAG: quinone-dependent dihydroorotate dehydrogenase [Candidatus Levybacteria bacterium]|nr:quinone-dependent dihydroorotate dehydrogenase [Candidatus Levybacteria bacterium]